MTSTRNRFTSSESRSSACWLRSESSSRRDSITDSAVASVVKGLRSSCATSEVNRASRAIWSCSASTIELNEVARTRRSLASRVSILVSSSPLAIALAAMAARRNGARARRAAHRPMTAPSTVAMAMAMIKVPKSTLRVWVSVAVGKIETYVR